jgi:hypothetical protein
MEENNKDITLIQEIEKLRRETEVLKQRIEKLTKEQLETSKNVKDCRKDIGQVYNIFHTEIEDLNERCDDNELRISEIQRTLENLQSEIKDEAMLVFIKKFAFK